MRVMENNKTRKKSGLHIPPPVAGIIDAFLVNAGYLLAFGLRFQGDIPVYNLRPFLQVVPWLSIATVVIFGGLGLYEKQRNGFINILRALITGIVCVLVATMAITFWLRGFAFPRSVLLLGFLIQVLLLVSWRFLYWYWEKRAHGLRQLLVIGPGGEVEKLLEKVLDLPHGWFKVKDVLDTAFIDELAGRLAGVDAVLLMSTSLEGKKASILHACQKAGCDVFLVPDFYDILLINSRIAQFDDMPVMEIRDISLTCFQRMVKRTFDIFIAASGLLVAGPLLVVLGIVIRITSPGPVLYTQPRVGRGGRVFHLLKLRTMVQNAEKGTGPVLAAENDPRITRVGRFLRAARLDEVPQLINVLKGEMSFVGPRPERPVFVQVFEREYPDYNYRHVVKPGITGLAQVAARYTTSPEDKLKFDLYYITSYSLLMDLKIILKTIPVLFNRESSAGKKNTSPDKRAAIYNLVNKQYEDKKNCGNGGL